MKMLYLDYRYLLYLNLFNYYHRHMHLCEVSILMLIKLNHLSLNKSLLLNLYYYLLNIINCLSLQIN
jgi:hypothetical protein